MSFDLDDAEYQLRQLEQQAEELQASFNRLVVRVERLECRLNNVSQTPAVQKFLYGE